MQFHTWPYYKFVRSWVSETRCTGLCPKSLHLLIVLIEIEIYRQGIYLKIQLWWEFSYENDKTWHIGRILHSESIAGWCQADIYQLHLQNIIHFNMVAIWSPSWIWSHFENFEHFFSAWHHPAIYSAHKNTHICQMWQM